MFVVLEGITNSGKTTVLNKLENTGKIISKIEFKELFNEAENINLSQDYYLKKYYDSFKQINEAKKQKRKFLIVSHYFEGSIAYLSALGKPTDKLSEYAKIFPEPDFKILLSASFDTIMKRDDNRIHLGNKINILNRMCLSFEKIAKDKHNWHVIMTDNLDEDTVLDKVEEFLNNKLKVN